MQAILAGIAAAIVITVAVGLLLPAAREPAYQAFSTSSTRIGEPGENLVGHDWNASRLHKEF